MAGWNNKQTKLVNKRWKLNPQLFQELDILYESKHQRILPEIKWEKRTEEVLGWSYVWRRNELGGKEALCTWLLLFGLFAKSQPLRFGAVSTAPAETEGRRQAETREHSRTEQGHHCLNQGEGWKSQPLVGSDWCAQIKMKTPSLPQLLQQQNKQCRYAMFGRGDENNYLDICLAGLSSCSLYSFPTPPPNWPQSHANNRHLCWLLL